MVLSRQLGLNHDRGIESLRQQDRSDVWSWWSSPPAVVRACVTQVPQMCGMSGAPVLRSEGQLQAGLSAGQGGRLGLVRGREELGGSERSRSFVS